MSNLKKFNDAVLALLVTIVVAIIDIKRILPHNIYSLLFVIAAYVYIFAGIKLYNKKDQIRETGIKYLKKIGYYLLESIYIGTGIYGFYRNLPGYRAHGIYIYVTIIAILYVMTLMYRYGLMITDQKEKKKYALITIAMVILHDCIYLFPANDSRPGKVTGAVFILLIGIFTVLQFFNYDKIKPLKALKERHPVKFTYTMYFITMWLIFATLETLSKTNVFEIKPWNWIMNMIFVFIVSGILYIITKKIKPALLITLAIWVILGLINGYLILFRGSPVLPADIYLIHTASEVSANYSYLMPYYIAEGIFVAMFTMTFILRIKDEKPNKKNRKVFNLSYLAVAILTVPMVIGNERLNHGNLDLWMPIGTYRTFGALNGFSLNLLAMQVEKPEGYSVDAANKVLEGYESDEADTTRTPNIIVIMDEAFSDLTKVGDYKTNKEVLPYLNSLNKNIIKGYTYSSVLGGTTANSEYEFQSSNPTAFLPAGTVPYQQYIQGDTNSFTRTLKSLGYSATSFHAYRRNTYRREIVYPLLGFDEYLAMDSIENPEYLRSYITDETDFEKVISLYEERDQEKPFYLFNVTMQNHSAYDTGDMEYNIKLEGGTEYADAEEYLSCVSQTDEALKTLINYFSNVDEETYIVFFGDHQPNLYSGFFEELLGGEINNLSVEDLQKRYVVPFFIWSNQEMESKNVNLISNNYLSSLFLQEANLPMTAYNKYLMDLFNKYPVINKNGYIDASGKYYDANEIRENAELVDYNKLVYNAIIDKNEGLQWAYELKQKQTTEDEAEVSPSPTAVTASPDATK
ncbi:MAG: LTA synthase family protein [bacterium]|nr:LTA synthase family protein [bacterium]